MPTAAGRHATAYRAAARAAAQCAASGRPCPLDGLACEPGAHTAPALEAMALEALATMDCLPETAAAAIGHAGRRIECYLYGDGSILAYCDDGYAPTAAWVVRGKLDTAIILRGAVRRKPGEPGAAAGPGEWRWRR